MSKESKGLTIHNKMENVIEDLLDKEIPIKEALREFEKIFIEKASRRCNNNKTRVAKALGIHRNTLHNLYKTLKIK